jgi:hypothetical protein
MKKIFTFFIAVALVSLFASCKGNNSYNEGASSGEGAKYGEAIYGESQFK